MPAALIWHHPPEKPVFQSNQLHIWQINRSQSDKTLDALWEFLSDDEKARAERFRFPRDRNRYIAGRGAMRDILSRYVQHAPQALRFYYGLNGKPYLTTEFNSASLYFNLSHSNELALLGVFPAADIGIDIEFAREKFSGKDIAERYFSEFEISELESLPETHKVAGFFNCWTRKEAFIKALGDGLSRPLSQFDVTLKPEAEAKLLRTEWDTEEAKKWVLQDISVAPKYHAAVAVKAKIKAIQLWHWYAMPQKR